MSIPTGKFSVDVKNLGNEKIKIEKKTEGINVSNLGRRYPNEDLDDIEEPPEDVVPEDVPPDDIEEDNNIFEQFSDVPKTDSDPDSEIKKIKGEYWEYKIIKPWSYLKKYDYTKNFERKFANEIQDNIKLYNLYVVYLRKTYRESLKENKVSLLKGNDKIPTTIGEIILSSFTDMQKYMKSYNEGEKMVPEIRIIIEDSKKQQHILFLDEYLETIFLKDIITKDLNIPTKLENFELKATTLKIISMFKEMLSIERNTEKQYLGEYKKARDKSSKSEWHQKSLINYELRFPIKFMSVEIYNILKGIQNENNKNTYEELNTLKDFLEDEKEYYKGEYFLDKNYIDKKRVTEPFPEDKPMYWFVIRFGGYMKYLLYYKIFKDKRDESLKEHIEHLKTNLSVIFSQELEEDDENYLINGKYYNKEFINKLRSYETDKERRELLLKVYTTERTVNGQEKDLNEIALEYTRITKKIKDEIDKIWWSIKEGIKYHKDYLQVFPVIDPYYILTENSIEKNKPLFIGKENIYNIAYQSLSKIYNCPTIDNRYSIRTYEESIKLEDYNKQKRDLINTNNNNDYHLQLYYNIIF